MTREEELLEQIEYLKAENAILKKLDALIQERKIQSHREELRQDLDLAVLRIVHRWQEAVFLLSKNAFK